jgi:hypothetical protein
MIPEVIIGIDNGFSGALVALDTQTLAIVDMLRMPVKKCPWRGNTVDVAAVATWLRSFRRVRCVVFEECPEHANQASIMRSMGYVFGQTCAAIEFAGLADRLRFVRSGNPRDSWQRVLFQGWNATIAGQTKELARQLAARHWPRERWIPPGCRAPHTGLIDAALIALFAIRFHCCGDTLPLVCPLPEKPKKKKPRKSTPSK